MTEVYAYGSGECDQLGLGEMEIYETKKAKLLKFELSPGIPSKSIIRISCGGLHTVALCRDGVVFSWGNNDDGALGRNGAENTPLRVDGALNIPVTDIVTGDCHSIAYSTISNLVFFWGSYKDSSTGKSTQKQPIPVRLAPDLFNQNSKTKVKKIDSGAQHSLALTDCGKVYSWGEHSQGKIGRIVGSRGKSQQITLDLEKIGAKNAINIFCGKNHSFFIDKKNQIFAFGQNNHGQLGIGTKSTTAIPTKVKDLDPFEGDYVVEIKGGEHHSIARTLEGAVYCWGRNDEGQIGQGDLFGDFLRKQKAIEQQQKIDEEIKQQEIVDSKITDQVNQNIDAENTENKIEEQKSKKSIKKTHKIQSKKTHDDEQKYIGYFPRPQLVSDLWKLELGEGEKKEDFQKKVSQIAAAGQYNYALVESKNELYSWGFGENYVLGNLKDENEFRPHKINPLMFQNKKVFQAALGTSHVVVITSDGTSDRIPELNVTEFVLAPGAKPSGEEVIVKKEKKGGKQSSQKGDKDHIKSSQIVEEIQQNGGHQNRGESQSQQILSQANQQHQNEVIEQIQSQKIDFNKQQVESDNDEASDDDEANENKKRSIQTFQKNNQDVDNQFQSNI